MKLQRLTIHNIASIEDASIDFSQSPLADSDVFLIAGKTGAGKSTILDAICLALYGTTPRLNSTEMQGNIRDAGNEIKIKNPGQLLRRGMAEGFVKLTFTGNNDCGYEAEWSISRARKKPNGKLQRRAWSLKRDDIRVPWVKEAEIEAEIAVAVGLDFTQFCRTTMLAQGDFSKFLNSKDADKAAILEKITGMDIYARIGKKIAEITAGKKSEWEKARLAVEGITLLLPEDIETIKKEIETIDKESGAKDSEIKVLREKASWLTEDSELGESREKAEKTLEETVALTSTDDFKNKIVLTERWERSADARASVITVNRDEKALKGLNDEAASLELRYRRLLAGILFESEKRESLRLKIKETEDFLKAEKERTSSYENSGRIITLLENLADGRKTIAIEKERSASLSRELEEKIKPETAKAEKTHKDLAGKADKLKEDIQKREEDIRKMDIPGLRSRLQKLTERIGAVQLAEKGMESLSLLRLRLAEDEKKSNETADAIRKGEEECKEMTPQVEKALAQEKSYRELYEGHKDSVDEFARTMRAHLHIGDQCPVCLRSIDTLFESEEKLRELVKRQKDLWKEAEKKRKDLETRLNKLTAKTETLSQLHGKEKTEIEEERRQIELKRAEVEGACRDLGIEYSDEAASKALEALRKDTERDRKSADASLTKATQKEKDLAELRKLHDTELKATDKALKALNLLLDRQKEHKSRIEASALVIRTKSEETLTLETTLSNLIEGEWETDWHSRPQEFKSHLKKASEKYAAALRTVEDTTKTFDKISDNISVLDQTKNRITTLMEGWGSLAASEALEVPDINAMATTLVSDVAGTLAAIGGLRDEIDRNNKLIADFIASDGDISREELLRLAATPAEEIKSVTDYLTRINTKVVEARTSLREVKERIEKHLKARPAISEEETPEAIADGINALSAATRELSEKKGSLMRRLEEDAGNRRRLEGFMKEIESRKKEFDRWYRLDSLLGSREGDKFRKIAQSYVLKSLVESANLYMATLSGRYRLLTAPNSFVIYVEDAYQGGATRSAGTLSGGETFIVSLSLALALSDIGDKLGVNTLFIDEGFGTLSGEPLRNAISTLRSLHSKTGRHVGIISHVEELREKIPVQILVEQDGIGAAGTIRICSGS